MAHRYGDRDAQTVSFMNFAGFFLLDMALDTSSLENDISVHVFLGGWFPEASNLFFCFEHFPRMIDRKGFKYALACGSSYVRIVETPKMALVLTMSCAADAADAATRGLCFTKASGETIHLEVETEISLGKVKEMLMEILEPSNLLGNTLVILVFVFWVFFWF